MATLKETQELASQSGQRIELHTADVSDRDAVDTMVQKSIDLFGKIDILVNNAGVYKAARFTDYTYEEFDRIMKVNVYGVFSVTQPVIKHMLERKTGKVINIASTAGKWASMNQSAYNTSKHAVVGMTRCLALEMAQHGINVNAICPGLVETDMVNEFSEGHAKIMGVTPEQAQEWVLKQRVPMGRWLQPEEIAHLATYLASSDSDGMTGQSILLDAGMLYV
jgi:NAD(P)-dependent dehydrogenase (short-subunit alcohol dehydrogenase family)